MKDRLKGRLMALFPKANLSKERLDKILDRLVKKVDENADDAALDAVINEANDLMDFEALAREDDRIRTLEAEAKKKAGEGNPGGKPGAKPDSNQSGGQNKNEPSKDDEIPAWAEKFFQKLESIEKSQVKDSKRKTVSDLFEKSNILKGLKPELKEKWINRIDLEAETSFEDQIKELETEYTELVQVNADNNEYAGPAGSGKGEVKPDDKIVEDIVDDLRI